ncbi:S8 family serine peptidase [Paenibacillus tyrfis]|uniref:S8 family serine peptidase n=1 Tax=Paenibacillus tyrfis TaxID=1501230 RepID=UPI0020A10859|nr:S8 family serine peptidase [Paenibacillus tyrfis]MCP1311278.1 S8 family serine peptidase [Paenibacillus tyrfis]
MKKRWLHVTLATAIMLSPFLAWSSGKVQAAEGNLDARSSFPPFSMPSSLVTQPANVDSGKVWVKYKEQARSEGSAGLLAAGDSDSFVEMPLAPGENVLSAVERYKQDPAVAAAEPEYLLQYADPAVTEVPDQVAGGGGSPTVTSTIYQPNDPYYANGSQWGLSVTEMTYAWERVQDRFSIRIAIVDSGVNPNHSDLAGSLEAGYNALDEGQPPVDDSGHGTMVAGIAAAVTNNGIGIAGAAGGARIVPVKVGKKDANNKDYIPSSAVAQGIRWAADNKVDVINISLGMPQNSQMLKEAVDYALARNVVIVAAAGNESNHWLFGEPVDFPTREDNSYRRFAWTVYPARYEGVVSVGSVSRLANNALTISDFSNIGKITTVAQGTGVYSTALSGGYASGAGTSYSSPMVAGLAALLKAQNKNLSSQDVHHILLDSSQKLGVPPIAGYYLGTYYSPKYQDYYGGGLMNGKRAFTMPRLRMTAVPEPDGRQANVTVKALDDKGTLLRNLSSEITVMVNHEDRYKQNKTVSLVNGEWSGPVELSVTDDVYDITIQANDAPGSGNEFIESGAARFSKLPDRPKASIGSGTYTGPQTVTLSTATPGAAIYITYDGLNSIELEGPLTISSNTTFYAAAMKNGVWSETAEYAYIIQPAPAGGGGGGGSSGCCAGGGGGGGWSGAPAASGDGKSESGSVLSVKPDKAKLLEQLAAAKGAPVTIDAGARSDSAVKQIIVELPGEVWLKAAEAGSAFVVRSDQASLTIPPDAFAVESAATPVKLTVTMSQEAPGKPAYAGLASPVFDFTLQAGDRTIEAFNKNVTVLLRYDSAKIGDAAKTGIYVYNAQAGRWEYVGGKAENGAIQVRLSHFSSYAVMEWNRTFDDIAAHWAKTTIERMAAKQIADGMTETAFAPEATMTRAQFAALLARTLKLPPGAKELPFKDVPHDAWYRDALAQALAAKLVSGVSDTAFAPEAPVTREQMALMLMNAYGYVRGAETQLPPNAPAFTDREAVSDWAKDSVGRAAGLGLLEGNPDGSFEPNRQATRAQAVTVLHRLLDQMEK